MLHCYGEYSRRTCTLYRSVKRYFEGSLLTYVRVAPLLLHHIILSLTEMSCRPTLCLFLHVAEVKLNYELQPFQYIMNLYHLLKCCKLLI